MATETEDTEELKKDSEEAGEAGESDEPVEKKGPSKKLIILGAIVIMVLGVGGGAFFFAGELLDSVGELLDSARGLPGGEFVVGLLGGEKKSAEEVAAEYQEGDASAEKGGEDDGKANGDKGKKKGGHGKAEKNGQSESGASVDLKSFLVNLADPERRRYLRTTLYLSLHEGKNTEILEEKKLQIRDTVLMLLSSKLASELLTVDGKVRLKEEIVDQVNATLSKEVVAKVYFVDFIIQ